MAADQKMMFCYCHQGYPWCSTSAFFIYLFYKVAAIRTSLHPRFSLVSSMWTIWSCIPCWGTLDRYLVLWQLVHSKNHQLVDRRICDSANNICSKISLSPVFHCMGGDVCTCCCSHLHPGEQKTKEFLRRGMIFCPYLHQVQIRT